jgi:methylmalonyl-CoA mutase cobalamin-binding subunit
MTAVDTVERLPKVELHLLDVEIGRTGDGPLAALAGALVSVRSCGATAEVVQLVDDDCPDAIIVTIGRDADVVASVIQAVRARPLGSLVPVVVLDGGRASDHPILTSDGALEAGADRFFGAGTPANHIVATVAELLGIDLKIESDQPAPTPTPAEEDTTALTPSPAPSPESDAATVEVMARRTYQPELSTPRFDPAKNPRQHEAAGPDTIIKKLRQSRHEDYFTVLEVRKGSDLRAVELSYERLRQSFDPAYVARPVSDRLHVELLEICDTLDDAFAVLSDSHLREDYLRAILAD